MDALPLLFIIAGLWLVNKFNEASNKSDWRKSPSGVKKKGELVIGKHIKMKKFGRLNAIIHLVNLKSHFMVRILNF